MTNRYWCSGTWSSRVRVWFGDQLTVPTLEIMVPLLTSVGTRPGGTIPSSQSGVKGSIPGVLVTTLSQKSRGKVTFTRVWELTGESCKLTLHLLAGSSARIIRPVNLSSNSQGHQLQSKAAHSSSRLAAVPRLHSNWNRFACGYRCFPVGKKLKA